MLQGTPPAEVAIDEALVRSLLEEQHPDLAGLPLRVAEAGWDNAMFRLGDDLAVRLPRRALAAPLIINEQTWLPRLASQLTLPAPIPTRTGTPSQGYPWHWSVVPWLAGHAADHTPPDGAQAKPFAAFLKALHLPAPDNAPVGVPLAERAESTEERWERLKIASVPLPEAIEHVWQHALAAPLSSETRWLHGDLHARNVLVKDGTISGIIDWGDITAGDVALDLASIWALFGDAVARRAALAAYDASEEETARAMGWAVFCGIVLLETGLADTPRHAEMGRLILERLDEDEEDQT